MICRAWIYKNCGSISDWLIGSSIFWSHTCFGLDQRATMLLESIPVSKMEDTQKRWVTWKLLPESAGNILSVTCAESQHQKKI